MKLFSIVLKISLIIILGVSIFAIYIYHTAKNNSFKSYYNGHITDHFDGKKFHNIKKNTLKTNDKTVFNYFKNKLLGKGAIWPSNIKVDSVDPREIMNKSNSDSIFLVNHATILLNINGYNVLTDPIWSEYASPLQFLGPKRKADPGIKFDELPRIDLVLISHNHYDHLDSGTVRKLVKDHNPLFIIGLGVKGNLLNMGVSQDKIIELDWWDDYDFVNSKLNKEQILNITFTPAQHFSSRFLDDKNSTLWGGFVIKSNNKTIYFAGDTGYDIDLFSDIKQKFHKVDISLLPIGAYKPYSFRYVHMNPEEAVKASKLLGSKINIPIHYGTFILSFENYEDPILDLNRALKDHKLNPNHFSILKNGDYIILDKQENKK